MPRCLDAKIHGYLVYQMLFHMLGYCLNQPRCLDAAAVAPFAPFGFDTFVLLPRSLDALISGCLDAQLPDASPDAWMLLH